MTEAPTTIHEARELSRWQRRLLPFLIAAISFMTLFFFVSSVVQLDRLGKAVSYKPDDRVERSLQAFERSAKADVAGLDYLEWKTRVQLERDALGHRYAQVNATLMLRAWTRHLGFLTGMILAMTGAIFILAKLREDVTQLSGEGGGAKASLATSSPGIVLTVLGTVLMIVTLTANFEFSTTDVPVYLPPAGAGRGAQDLPTPKILDSPEQRASEEQELFQTGPEETSNAQ